MTASFQCGDAAGRPKTATRPKDFSDSDIKFAANAGLRFMTPEQLFLNEKPERSTKTLIESFFKKPLLTKPVSDQKEEIKKEEEKKTSYTSEK